jgi:hypothetical protein
LDEPFAFDGGFLERVDGMTAVVKGEVGAASVDAVLENEEPFKNNELSFYWSVTDQ